MSTWIYLECLDHEPPLQAEDESGQHLYDLPQIRADIRDREVLARLYGEGAVMGQAHVGFFRANTARFLAQHQKCRIGIRDERGVEHPIEVSEVT